MTKLSFLLLILFASKVLGAVRQWELRTALASLPSGTLLKSSKMSVSPDGLKHAILCDSGKAICVSSNGGTTWRKIAETQKVSGKYQSLDMSSDGKKLGVIDEAGKVIIVSCSENFVQCTLLHENQLNDFKTVDDGINVYEDNFIAMSSDGQYVTVAGLEGKIYVSNDFGNSFAQKTPVWAYEDDFYFKRGLTENECNNFCQTLQCPKSQYNVIAGEQFCTIFPADPLNPSNLLDSSWDKFSHTNEDKFIKELGQKDPKGGREYFTCLAMNENGMYQVASGIYTFHIYVSADYGVTWKRGEGLDNLPNSFNFYDVAVSKDGMFMSAMDASSNLWRSKDYGNNWEEIVVYAIDFDFPPEWSSIAMSDDGVVQSVVDSEFKKVYTSFDKGSTWNLVESVSSGNGEVIFMNSDGTQKLLYGNGLFFYEACDRPNPVVPKCCATEENPNYGVTPQIQSYQCCASDGSWKEFTLQFPSNVCGQTCDNHCRPDPFNTNTYLAPCPYVRTDFSECNLGTWRMANQGETCQKTCQDQNPQDSCVIKDKGKEIKIARENQQQVDLIQAILGNVKIPDTCSDVPTGYTYNLCYCKPSSSDSFVDLLGLSSFSTPNSDTNIPQTLKDIGVSTGEWQPDPTQPGRGTLTFTLAPLKTCAELRDILRNWLDTNLGINGVVQQCSNARRLDENLGDLQEIVVIIDNSWSNFANLENSNLCLEEDKSKPNGISYKGIFPGVDLNIVPTDDCSEYGIQKPYPRWIRGGLRNVQKPKSNDRVALIDIMVGGKISLEFQLHGAVSPGASYALYVYDLDTGRRLHRTQIEVLEGINPRLLNENNSYLTVSGNTFTSSEDRSSVKNVNDPTQLDSDQEKMGLKINFNQDKKVKLVVRVLKSQEKYLRNRRAIFFSIKLESESD